MIRESELIEPDRPGRTIAHERILASAGSGKTYQLVARYLALVVAGAEPSSILVSSFTRAAAGEVRGRIIRRLLNAARDEQDRAALAASAGVPTLGRDEVVGHLRTLVRHGGELNIRTLDAFLASIVTGFALELGLPPSLNVLDETQEARLRVEAVRLTLDTAEPEELADLLRQFTQGVAGRAVAPAIDGIVADLLELYHDSAPEAWEAFEAIPGWLEASTRLQLVTALRGADPAPLDQRGAKAVLGVADLAAAEDWEALLENGFVVKVVAGETYNKREAPLVIVDPIRSLVDHAMAWRSMLLREQTIATRDLLAAVARRLGDLKRDRRGVTFGDLTRLVIDAIGHGTLEEICYRIDGRLRHILLDEFQDTSARQWRAIEPFVREVVANQPPEASFFCVGDLKQSIYGWRGGEPEILDRLPELLDSDDQAIRPVRLDRSRRSAMPVLECVNEVFSRLAGNPALEGLGDSVQQWSRWFRTHGTAVAAAGYAAVHVAEVPPPPATDAQDDDAGGIESAASTPPDDGEGRIGVLARRRRVEIVRRLVVQTRRDAPDARIGVLVRTNAMIPEILAALSGCDPPIAASGRGGGPLTDAAAVNTILDLLWLADHPDDTIAAWHVSRSPLVAAMDLDPALGDPAARSERRSFARSLRRRLIEEGYATVLGDLAARVAPACEPRERARLLQLVEVAEAWDARASLRPGEFVRAVLRGRVEEPAAAVVEVMTVHQAKGQEFDVAIIAELGAPLYRSTPPVVWVEREGIAADATMIVRSCAAALRERIPRLEALEQQRRVRESTESLALLYVAMTRARLALHLVLDAPKVLRSNDGRSLGRVVRCALGRDDVAPGSTPWTYGDPRWFEKATFTSRPPNVPERPPLPTTVASIAMSSAHAPSAKPGARRAVDSEGQRRGRALHALFEQVERLEDFAAADEALRAVIRNVDPRAEHPWIDQRLAEFRTMLGSPAISAALRVDDEPGVSIEIRREHPFARLASAGLQRGVIDRLVIRARDGRPIDATIIDYKSDRVGEEGVALLVEAYRAQLEAYRDVVREWIGVENVRARLVFVDGGEVVEV